MRKDKLEGKVFGRLTVVGEGPRISGRVSWSCLCDCGSSVVVRGHLLKSGETQSCGCMRTERLVAMNKTHGEYDSRTHRSWSHMLSRVRNPKHHQFKDYGGRGITVCDRWLKFENFLEDMGQRPEGKTLDRMEVDGNYEPSNCRWATPLEQAQNKRKKEK